MSPSPRLREHVPLAPFTTLRVGGPARWFLEAETEAEVAEAFAWAKEAGLPVTVLGGGSNLLVADRGIDGLVLRIAIRKVVPSEAAGHLEVGAGESLDGLVARTVADDLAGLECLSGIPGSVGATPIQNVGAYGQEVSESIVAVSVLDRVSGRQDIIAGDACGFGYRTSAFKNVWRDRYVVLSVRFALRPGGMPKLQYQELLRHFSARGIEEPSLREVREAVLSLRRSKSMVLDAEDENGKSAGSFFVNPIVEAAHADEIADRAGSESAMPRYPAGNRVKLSAAWLIERAGFPRGTCDGHVGLSTRHALAVVNKGGASAAEIIAFASRIRASVRKRFGVTLSHEPELVGFERAAIADFID